MHVDLGIWERLRRVVVFLLFIAGVLAVIVWYLPLIRQNERMRQEIFKKNLQVKQEEERGRQMENTIRALRTDPRAVERLAREKLGYIKPGETRIQFEPGTTNSLVAH
ncbi:MAG: septum formation initiator family protein [Verrucomicrobiota bacterium]